MSTRIIQEVVREVLENTEVTSLVTKKDVDQLSAELVNALHRKGFIDALLD